MAHQFCKQQVIVVVAVVAVVAALCSEPAEALEPMVDTGVSKLSPEGRHVSVNVPAFFNMALDTRGPKKGFRLTESIMSGLVKLFIDRERTADGKMKGPIKVDVGGMTVYNNNQSL